LEKRRRNFSELHVDMVRSERPELLPCILILLIFSGFSQDDVSQFVSQTVSQNSNRSSTRNATQVASGEALLISWREGCDPHISGNHGLGDHERFRTRSAQRLLQKRVSPAIILPHLDTNFSVEILRTFGSGSFSMDRRQVDVRFCPYPASVSTLYTAYWTALTGDM
jgi:hypothetical protein